MQAITSLRQPAWQLTKNAAGMICYRAFRSTASCLIAHSRVALTSEQYKNVHRANFKTLDSDDISFFKGFMDPVRVNTDSDELEAYNIDWIKKYRGSSRLVLKPKSTEEVSKILAYCNNKRLAIVPQGGNTGLVGGSVPVFDEIVLSMGLMNKILHFDDVSGILTCEAGCILEWLNDQMADKGFMMPLDLGAKGSCHIGGNVATNAGGIHFLRYGNLHGNVLGLKVVLPDGRIVDTISPCRKDNTGYDIKQLFIGSEGTLGVITALSILTPAKPKAVNVALLGCNTYDDVCKILAESKAQLGETLSACEFLDDASMSAVISNLHRTNPLSGSYPFYAVVETAGSSNEHDMAKLDSFLADIMEKEYCLDGTLAQDSKQAADIWALREGVAEALMHDGAVYKYDVSIPIPKMYDLVVAMRERLPDALRVTGYGHVGDGNLHLNITASAYNQALVDKIEPFVYEWT
eukprot:Ihof_evm2s179 gene=Ihof_evmTU2s179